MQRYLERSYVPELDGLRALSVLIVVTAHMHDRIWEWLTGYQGVTVFFVLSGYLITTLALREERARGRVSLKAFYVRRTCRIFPLYYLTLGIYAVALLGLGLYPQKREGFIIGLPYLLFYFQEWPFVYGTGTPEGMPLYQAWSLGIEEKFYLLWPMVAFVLWRGRMRWRQVGAIVLMLVLAATPFYVPGKAWRLFFPYYHILVGCVVALLLDDPQWFGRLARLARPVWATLITVAMVAVHFALPLTGNPFTTEPLWRVISVLYTLICGAFLVVVLLGTGPVQRVLSWRPLVKVGKLSYGIYLIHVLAIHAAQKIARPHTGYLAVSILAYVLACALAIAAAEVLARLVEQPLIAMGRRISRRILASEPAEAKPQLEPEPMHALAE